MNPTRRKKRNGHKFRERKNYRGGYYVQIIKPHNRENLTHEQTNHFISKAIERGIAEYTAYAAQMPEFARNTAIISFLNDPQWRNKTHLFFIDDDSPPVDEFAIERLLSHHKPVVAGVTPIITNINELRNNCRWSVSVSKKIFSINTVSHEVVNENIGIFDLPKKGLFKASRVGGTCLLVSREVLEKIRPPYQRSRFNKDITDTKLSEDFYFCEKIKKAGFDIWVDPEVECHHWHQFDLLDFFAAMRQMKEEKAHSI